MVAAKTGCYPLSRNPLRRVLASPGAIDVPQNEKGLSFQETLCKRPFASDPLTSVKRRFKKRCFDPSNIPRYDFGTTINPLFP